MLETFIQKAEAVSAVVRRVRTLDEAFCHAAAACRQKPAGRSNSDEKNAGPAPRRIMAAPNLPPADFKRLLSRCRKESIKLIRDGLRDHPTGFDFGFTRVDYAIADTGTLVLNCKSEALRLATMLCDTHMALLPVSRLRATATDLLPELRAWMDDPADYTTFITGASRTADIERVLALGVHGPLELHILVWEGG